MGANGIEDVPPKGRLRKHDWRKRPIVRRHHVANALRLARHQDRQQAGTMAAQVPKECDDVATLEIVRENDGRCCRARCDHVKVPNGVRALRRDARRREIGLKAVERLRVRRND